MNNIIDLTDINFKKEVLDFKGIILVDFWADWCASCKIFSKILNEISYKITKDINIGKYDISKNNIYSNKFLIKSIPTIILFKNGKLISTSIGSISKNKLLDFINTNT